MSGYILKAVAIPVTFLMDWRRGYLAPGERVFRDLGWAVQSNAPEGVRLTVTAQEHDEARSWATFAGGAAGRVYMVSNRIRTSDDRVLGRAVVMRIALGERPQ